MPYDNPTSRSFAAEFNRRLGQYTRNPAVRTPETGLVLDLQARLVNERQRELAVENMEREERAKKNWENRVKESSGGGGRSGSGVAKYGNLSQDTANLLTDESNTGLMAKIDLPGWVPGNKTISNVVTGALEPFKTPFLWTVDKLSRPSYAAFEGLQSYQEARNAGENPFESLDNLGRGAGRGITGEDKTGFGEVIETLANAPGSENPMSFDSSPDNAGDFFGNLWEGIQNIDRISPFSLKSSPLSNDPETGQAKGPAGVWGKRVAGLGGELFLDPTNVVGGKVFTTVGDIAKATDNADEAYRALVRESVDDAVNSRGLQKAFDKQRPRSMPDPNNPGKKISPNVPYRTDLHEAAERGINNSTIRIGGGATRGRFIGADVGAYSIADNVSNEMRNVLLKNFDDVHKQFNDILAGSKTLTKAEIQLLRKDPFVAAYLDELLRITRKANPASSLADVERLLLKYSTRNKDKILSMSDQAATFAKKQLDNTIADVRKEIFKKLDNQVKNIPGVRIGSKGIPFKRIGTAYHAAKSKIGTPLEGIQFQNQFPSVTPQISNAVKSTGQEAYELFHADVQEIVKRLELTKAERKEFNSRILTNTPAPTARLQEAQDFIKRAYREMWQNEVDAGIRSADDVMPDNYVYNYYKAKGAKKYAAEVKNYKQGVKQGVKGSKSLSADHITAAQARGLKVEQDAFRALLYRQMKSNRKLTQAWFKRDLINNFGIMANRMSPELATANRLTKVSEKLEKGLKDQLGDGDNWYLPDDIAAVLKKYADMTGANVTDEMTQWIHMLDTVTRMFKQMATIYYPGFHIRNSMGDMWMSFLDGVRASDYFATKRFLKKARLNPSATEVIAGVPFKTGDIKKLFDENVSTGGFKRVDFDVPEAITKVDPRRGSNLIREKSEAREDFFRFTHFLHAFKEELPHALKNGVKQDVAIRNATRAASYRVNKYLFDYGATTLFEKKYLKRIFPFYTYMRKAMPALSEAMYLHPSQFAKTNRFFLDDDDGSYADMLTPSYQREAGYMDLGQGGEEPWLLGGQFLPTDVLNKNTNILDVPDWSRNIMSQTSPFAKLLPELGAGEQFFNEKPITSNREYFSDSFLPPVKPTKDLLSVARDIPGIPGDGDSSKLLSGRFGLGLPFTQITNNKQTAALYGIKDEYEKELGKYNAKLEAKGFRLYLSPRKDGASFRIRNENTGDVVFDTTSVQEAIQEARRLSR